jgi:predicted transposase YbfD/YdcC
MVRGFLDCMGRVPDHRIRGMITYPFDEVLLATLVGVVCGADDWDGVVEIAEASLDWLRGFLPYKEGIPTAQTFRKVFRLIDRRAMSEAFAAWAASVRRIEPEIVAIDGKTLRGSKKARGGEGALHLVSAYATQAGLVLGQRAVEGKSNEIKAIPELLNMLALEGAIVTIDAMGTQKDIAARIVDKGGKYVLSLKGNQPGLLEDAKLYFDDPGCAAAAVRATNVDAGHGRVEERVCRAVDAQWLAERHPEWKGLKSLAVIEASRIDKKTGAETREARFYISALEPDPDAILAATRSHWGIENKLHWTLDVTFDEDRYRTRKDNSAHNLAIVRHAALNILRADASKGSIRRKRLRACASPQFRSSLFATKQAGDVLTI